MWGRGTVLSSRYTLTERLGGGAMGEVWRADDGVLERQVAVKILLPALLADAKFAERFRREAKVLAALDHPGIVDVHDYGESGSEPRVAYIVMELVDGRPLDAVLGEDDAADGDVAGMPVDRVLGIAAQALDALHAAHLRGIVHRDVKPSNLMIGADDRVTVTDFGIAHSTAETKLTASHAVLGTARYIAPEQALGNGAVPASDQYAIGVLCYELLTGEALFTGDAVLEVLLKHIREPAPELPAEFPEAVRVFVAKALAKAPEDRYADAAQMAAAARGAMTGGSEAAAAVTGDAAAGNALASKADSGNAVASKAASGGAAASSAVEAEPTPDGAGSDEAAAPDGSAPEATTDDAPIVREALAPAALPPAGPAAADVPGPAPAPAAVPVAVPVAEQSPTPPESSPDTRDAPEGTRAWKRHGIAAALLVLGVIAGVVATVLYVRPSVGPSDADGKAQNAQSATSGSQIHATGASGDSGANSAPPSGAAGTGTPSPNAGGTQAPGAAQGGTGASPGSGSTTGAVPPPGGGNGGGSNGSASGGAGASPGGSSTGSGTKPKPPASTPPPAQSIPQGCGGDRWGAITSVADGVKIGLVADGPSAGKQVVMGGHTQYGWVHSVSTWDTFNPCSLSGPALGQPYGNSQHPELAAGYAYSTNWRLADAPTSGAVYIKDYMGKNCLTNNGAGKPLSVVECTPGIRSQQWWIP
ncbi:serine/threonine-protein kinase [Embleya sp. NBC_00896]|uniref:serine/threonine-protein kinase n=1 Tax=Embleya sp. NBC_00896 TaxID=2975961 RepID=UPI00386EC204|nr:serine/threonine protein kinase [Embleya sp. NBC_00896]